MKALNNILESLDKTFESKSKNEIQMIIAMVFIAIGALSYLLFLPPAEKEYQASVKKKEKFQKSIRKHTEYLKGITVNGDRNYYVKKYDNDIKLLETKVETTNNDINFINGKLDGLSEMLFNKKSWSKFLNSLTHKAKAQDVYIDYIENNYVDNNGSFGHVLQISVGCNGEYKNIVKFINQIEKSVLVTDVYGSHIYLEDNNTIMAADVNISVWGINH